MTQRRVGVLLGGWGEEREISVKTGEAIAAALEARGHPVTRILAGPGLDQGVRHAQVDVAFLALHGRMGEDGKVQGLLEVLGLPYTGSGVLASALAMHKGFARRLFRQHNLATPAGYVVGLAELEQVEERHLDLGFPCVVKPAQGGSSVGLTLVHTLEQLRPAVAKACRYGGEALVERYVKGREVTVAVLGGEVLGACEVSYPGGTFDFETKYLGGARYHLPPRLSPTRVGNVEAMALTAYRALGCRGPARIDFLCPDVGNEVLLEVNTLPGMTPTSLFPKIARQAGLSFEDVCERILALAARDGADVLPEAPVPPMPAQTRHAS
ncbi:MAG: D-alanine--D-alanine ligase [Myxococcales bacterium]|nr:D-alanine--D-alanine ligase [Myxococcales bacterium]